MIVVVVVDETFEKPPLFRGSLSLVRHFLVTRCSRAQALVLSRERPATVLLMMREEHHPSSVAGSSAAAAAVRLYRPSLFVFSPSLPSTPRHLHSPCRAVPCRAKPSRAEPRAVSAARRRHTYAAPFVPGRMRGECSSRRDSAARFTDSMKTYLSFVSSRLFSLPRILRIPLSYPTVSLALPLFFSLSLGRNGGCISRESPAAYKFTRGRIAEGS